MGSERDGVRRLSGARPGASKPARPSAAAAERRCAAAGERPSCASAAGAVQMPPDSTAPEAAEVARASSSRLATTRACPGAAGSGGDTAASRSRASPMRGPACCSREPRSSSARARRTPSSARSTCVPARSSSARYATGVIGAGRAAPHPATASTSTPAATRADPGPPNCALFMSHAPSNRHDERVADDDATDRGGDWRPLRARPLPAVASAWPPGLVPASTLRAGPARA